MIKSDLQEQDAIAFENFPNEFPNLKGDISIQMGVFIEEILSELLKLKKEVTKLRNEVSRNKLMIDKLEKKKASYGKKVAKRASSMLTLINDFGGTMISTDAKEFMGLSKDEFYRTLQYARRQNLIELWPNLKDGRSYIIKLKNQ